MDIEKIQGLIANVEWLGKLTDAQNAARALANANVVSDTDYVEKLMLAHIAISAAMERPLFEGITAMKNQRLKNGGSHGEN